MKKSNKLKVAALDDLVILLDGIDDGLVELNHTLARVAALLAKHHAQDVALYERSIACSEEITRYAGRQTLVAECTLNAHLNSRTTPTEG